MAAARLIIFPNRSKKDGTTAIYAQVHLQGQSIRINTGVCVLPENFDKKKNRVKGNSKKVKDENLIIDKCLGLINEIFVRYRLQQKVLTPDLLIREYKNPSRYLDFYNFMDKCLLERLKGREIGATTERHQRVTLNKLKEFKTTLNFAEIDLKFIKAFRRWLIAEKNNDVNTIQKTMSYFQIYMNIAKREEIITSNPFDNIVFRRVTPQRIFLTEEELKKLTGYYDKNLYSESLHRSLRHFLFMCYTGLRISDFRRLKKENVQEDVLKFIPFKTRAKKQIELHVPLIDKARQLIQDEKSKYAELFDTITDQKYNEHLKEIAELGGIHKKITNHSARHTFATLFLEKTSDVATLQKIMGHSNIKETMVYVHISTKKISAQMNHFNSLLDL